MAPISKRFHRLPIGRQIKRKLNGDEEAGVVRGMYHVSAPEWRATYTVRWQAGDEVEYEEHLALGTVQFWYGPSDNYVDEPWVDEEIRLLQKVSQ